MSDRFLDDMIAFLDTSVCRDVGGGGSPSVLAAVGLLLVGID